MRGVSEKIIFGQNVNIGTGNFKIMIDRENVSKYNAKGKKDKEEYEDKVDVYMNSYNNKPFGLEHTPPIEFTPNPYGARSVRGMNSPYVYAGGTSSRSPLFTPMHSYHRQ